MKYSNKDYMKMIPNCFAVRGYTRSIIIDTNNRNIKYISNNHFHIIEELKIKSILEVLDKDKNKIKFIDYLIKNNLGIVFEKELISKILPMEDIVEIPFLSNSIVDINDISIKLIYEVLEKLSDANIGNVQFRILKNTTNQEIKELIFLLETFSFYSVEFLFSFELFLTMSNEEISIIERNQLITKVFVFNSKKKNIINNSKFLFLESPLNDYNLCGHTSIKYFSPFLETVINSSRYNSCLNCKISVDQFGQIKNCPSMKESFGNIRTNSLVDILSKKNFQKFNRITKDDIKVCQDCEFRYVCTDCRAYVDNPNDIYSRPSKCNYNPYICKWKDEEGYQTLEEIGVISNENGFSINHEKIASINKILWEEEVTENA